MDKPKTFVIVHSNFIGDNLLTNSLVQNIKRLYKNSKVISIVQPKMVDISKYQEGVDDVIVWDRKGKDKGFFKMLKFVFNFPYKNIYACFPIYGMDRPVMLSRLLGAKYVLCPLQKTFSRLRNSIYPISKQDKTCQENFANLLKGITKEEIINEKIRYKVPKIESEIIDKLPKNYNALVLTSTRKTKHIPLETACEILEKLKDETFVLLGKSQVAKEYSDFLKEKNYPNLIDLSNKTTLLETFNIIKGAKSMITADTGLMHLACAVGTSFVSVFYENDTVEYQPNEKMYNCINITQNQTTDSIVGAFKKLNKEEMCLI